MQPSLSSRQAVRAFSLIAVAVLAACNKAPEAAPPPQPVPPGQAAPAPAAAPAASAPSRQAAAPAPAAAIAAPPQAVYTDYQPPLEQPEPIAVPWAPPPLLAEYPPQAPSPDAFWTGGYWVWRDGWAWAPGRWATPPRPRYRWVPPYYEHRQDRVVFVNGFWAAPDVRFRPPAAGLSIALAAVGAGVAPGHAPQGPQGAFLPPPPGSRPGLLVPAPMGTSPVVMMRAPAIMASGMRVSPAGHVQVGNTTIDNYNTTVINNIGNVTIQAPAAATADHREVNLTVPAHARAAGAQAPAAPPPHSGPVASASAPAARHDAAPPPQPRLAEVPAPREQGTPTLNRPAPQAAPPAPRGQVRPPAQLPVGAPMPRPVQAPARPVEAAHPQVDRPQPAGLHQPRPAAAPRPEAVNHPPQARPAEQSRPAPQAAPGRPRPPEPTHRPGPPQDEHPRR